MKKNKVTTQSPMESAEIQYVSDVRSIERDMFSARPKDASDLQEMQDMWVEQIREIADECRVNLDELGDDLQQGPTGKQLEDRADSMDMWADEIEAVEVDWNENDEADAGITWPEYALQCIDAMAAYCPE